VSKSSGEDESRQVRALATTAGETPAESGRLEIGSRLANRYRVVGFLGRGGMGSVYLAVDEALDNTRVALKVVSGDSALEQLRREVLAAQRVTHRNVCRIYDLLEVDGLWMVKMEYIAGESLAARMAREPLAIPDALEIAHRIGDGLAAAHAQGIVHRDLKPHNVMIEKESGRVVLMDFGIARIATRESFVTGPAIVGTPAYMAPEQVRGGTVDARTDLYALGCLLYHLVVGDVVFPAKTPMAAAARHVDDPPPDPREKRADLPDWVATAILALLEKDPARRPANVEAAMRLFVDPAKRDAVPELRRRRSRRPWVILASAIAAALTAVAVIVVATRDRTPKHAAAWTPALRELMPSFDENSDPPAMSPDGTQLAFISDREQPGYFRVYVAPIDGGVGRAVTPPELDARHVLWTQDGKALTFFRQVRSLRDVSRCPRWCTSDADLRRARIRDGLRRSHPPGPLGRWRRSVLPDRQRWSAPRATALRREPGGLLDGL
jgi:serine/threonine protein kinase